MNLKVLSLAVILLFSLSAGSCKKETSDDLQKRADEFKAYLVGKSFIPVEFRSDIPIDYDEADGVTKSETDLDDYILPYLDDDTIVFIAGGSLTIQEGQETYHAYYTDRELPSTLTWSVETKKATQEVLFNYLDYDYLKERYILDHFTDSEILAHIVVTRGGQTAKLSTRFKRIYP